jgi:hypothetical protein
MAPRAKATKKKVKRQASDEDEGRSGIVIQINEGWRLAWDGLQFLCQRRQVRQSGKNKGKENWVSEAYICNLDTAIIWLARKQIFAIKGTYGMEGADKLSVALDTIKAEVSAAVKQGLDALERIYEEKYQERIAQL